MAFFFPFFPAVLHATRAVAVPPRTNEAPLTTTRALALGAHRFAIRDFSIPRKTKEFKIAKLREERREEAEAMYRLWKEAPEQWLLKSKIGWSTRHESRRAPDRKSVV